MFKQAASRVLQEGACMNPDQIQRKHRRDEDRVSTILPTHNRAHLVRRAIDSVLAQTEPGDEVIVLDDGSTDGTSNTLALYGDRIRVIRLEGTGTGLVSARNRGVLEACKPLVCFLDDDDEWLPGKLALQRSLLGSIPDILSCFSSLAVQAPEGRIDRGIIPGGEVYPRWPHSDRRTHERPIPFLEPPQPFSSLAKLPLGQPDCLVYVGDFSRAMLENGYASCCTIMGRREALLATPFTDDVGPHETWEFAARLSRLGRMAYLNADTTLVHRHIGPSLTGDKPLGSVQELSGRVALRESVWATDSAFLSLYGERHRELLALDRAALIKALLVSGDRQAAHRELAQLLPVPILLRLVAAFPTPLLNAFLKVRRTARVAFTRIRPR